MDWTFWRCFSGKFHWRNHPFAKFDRKRVSGISGPQYRCRLGARLHWNSSLNLTHRTAVSRVSWSMTWNKTLTLQQAGLLSNIHDSTIYPNFAQVSINNSLDWAQYLSLRVHNSNGTVINQWMQLEIVTGDLEFIGSTVLTGLVVNGLVRIGFSSQLQGGFKTTVVLSSQVQPDGNYWLSGKWVFQIILSAGRCPMI